MDQRGGVTPGVQAMINSGVAPPMTKIEQRGIEYVPLDHRWGKPASLFWMWAGAVWNVEFVLYGALAVLIFGLSFAQALVVIAIGNVCYLLTGLASLQGPRAGTATFAISRAPFGPNGNRVPSFFNWITLRVAAVEPDRRIRPQPVPRPVRGRRCLLRAGREICARGGPGDGGGRRLRVLPARGARRWACHPHACRTRSARRQPGQREPLRVDQAPVGDPQFGDERQGEEAQVHERVATQAPSAVAAA